MKVLITGGAGLIGSALARRFSAEGHTVFATARKNVNLFNADGIHYYRGDLRDRNFVEEIFDDQVYDAVLLCAGVKGGAARSKKDSSTTIDPLIFQANLLDVAADSGNPRTFLFSSSTVYPDSAIPSPERCGFIGEPHDSYFGIGWMNRYLEKLAEYYRRDFGLPVTVLRLATIYGPGDDFTSDHAQVIPSLIRRFNQSSSELTVWGDGTQIRDFLFTDDLCDAIMSLIRHEHVAGPVNIGSGVGTSVQELVSLIALCFPEKTLEIKFDRTKPVAIPYRVLDTSYLKDMFKFSPQHSIHTGLLKTVGWYKSNC